MKLFKLLGDPCLLFVKAFSCEVVIEVLAHLVEVAQRGQFSQGGLQFL
jgi:hypothetical protein